MYKITQKNNKNHVLKGVYQHLFCWVSDGKSCFSVRKPILTSERHTEHLFAGQNIQQSYQNEVKKLKKTAKKHILNSKHSAQHSFTGLNIQQLALNCFKIKLKPI